MILQFSPDSLGLNWWRHQSVCQFSRSIMSNSLWLHGLQHSRLPCPSLTLRACSNSCSLSRWYHPTISSSVVPFSSCLHSFPASGSFPMHQFFASGGQSIWVSTSSISPSNEYLELIFFRMDWLDLLQSKGLPRVFSNTTVQKHHVFSAHVSLWSNSCIDKTTGKTIILTRQTYAEIR